MPARCRCRDCAAGDALPDRLQGWPGAWQMTFLQPGTDTAMPPKSLDDWNYPGIREACAERCGEVGDPPCHVLNDRKGQRINPEVTPPFKPCAECWRDVGVEPGEEFDPNAAIGQLL